MPVRRIVVGQSVSSEKLARARELRKEMTPEERLVWERVRANRLHGLSFRRQQVIDGYVIDFYCHAAALVVEIDGPIHQEQATADGYRDRALVRRGLRVLRFTNDEVRHDLDGVIGRIAEACAKRPAEPIPHDPSSPPPRFGEGGWGEGFRPKAAAPEKGTP